MSYHAWDPKIETHCMSPESVNQLVSILAQLPTSAVMLEVGCYIGGVLCIMSDCRPDCSIHGIDDGEWSGKIGQLHPQLPDGRALFDLQDKTAVERFEEVIGTRKNITLHFGTSPAGEVCQLWETPLDLVHIGFDTQGYAVYMDNISWWWTKIKPNGWITGQAILDGKQAIDDFAAAHECTITWIDHFFACHKA